MRTATRCALKAVLVDLSGTFHVEESAVPGVQEALKRQDTNTMKECKRDLLERLTKLGFDIAENEIFTSLTAIRNLREQKQVQPLLLVDKKALPDFTGIATDDPIAVVVGLAPEHFHYEMMNEEFRLILDAGLEYAMDTKATVVEKSGKTFFLEALRGTSCAPEEAVMIGDDCRDDDSGAQDVGMRGILVRTGDEDKINPAPYLTCKSFPEMVEHILDRMLWEME
uniref:Haloacid dehalogenase-like hydrolase domain-containing protein 2 n=1 Tax=Anser cygnoides TaxID=8845 RepID=A0A8B9ET11_ANSCY